MTDILLTLTLGFLSLFSSPEQTLLHQIKTSGELIIATRNSPTTYYEGPQGYAGLEYDLAKAFAEELGVRLRLVVPPSQAELLAATVSGRVHFAAAGLVASDALRNAGLRFGPGYQQVTTQIVARKYVPQARKLEDLGHDNSCMMVENGSQHLEHLRALRETYPALKWRVANTADSQELLQRVWEQLIDYAVVSSHELRYALRFHPELDPIFDVSAPQPLAWAFPRYSRDDSLYIAAIQFFNKMRQSGKLKQLLDRYYGHIETFDYVNTRVFYRHIETRLPLYQAMFESVAAEYGIEWQLLAAIGYQESRWDPGAVSYTGVKGLMMLTHDAAQDVKVQDRQDPAQSIAGGAKHFSRFKARLPQRIPEPDRTWMALAAYNLGLGHVEDARVLAQRHKLDPDRWVDVEEYVYKLSKQEWFPQTRHGYARGFEAVQFVKRIREYYEILLRYQHQDDTPEAEPSHSVPAEVLSVDSPVL